MIEAFRALEHWMQENNINPSAVNVSFTADASVVRAVGMALRREAEKLRFIPGLPNDPIREGHIYGIRFSVDDRNAK